MNNSIRILPVSYDDKIIDGYDIELRMMSREDMIALADIIGEMDIVPSYLYNLRTKIKNTLEGE